jgi:hypothetical protein
LDLLKSGFYLELLLRCAPYSYIRVESRVADPSFDQEDAEDPGNEGVMSLPTI